MRDIWNLSSPYTETSFIAQKCSHPTARTEHQEKTGDYRQQEHLQGCGWWQDWRAPHPRPGQAVQTLHTVSWNLL